MITQNQNIKNRALIVMSDSQALAFSCLLQKELDNDNCDNREHLQNISDNIDDAFILNNKLNKKGGE